MPKTKEQKAKPTTKGTDKQPKIKVANKFYDLDHRVLYENREILVNEQKHLDYLNKKITIDELLQYSDYN